MYTYVCTCNYVCICTPMYVHVHIIMYVHVHILHSTLIFYVTFGNRSTYGTKALNAYKGSLGSSQWRRSDTR